MKYILLFIIAICFIGCVERIENMFVDTKKASPKYTSVGSINKNAPIIKEPKPKKEVFETKEIDTKAQKNPDYEMVGYVVSYQIDSDVGLYIYTFTDALRTERIKFYSKEKLPYKPTDLVKIYVQDNFLKDHHNYQSVNSRRNFNSYFKAAKEYIIKVK